MSGNVTKYDIHELLKREYDEISMGLTPSGYIHLGTLYTIAQPLLYLSEHNDTHIEICITDLDFDNKFTLAAPYHLAKTDGISNIERTKFEVETALEIYSDILEINQSTIKKNIEISLFSEKMKNEKDMLELFKNLVLDEDIFLELKRIWFGNKKKNKKNRSTVPYSIICPSCRLTDSGYATIDRTNETLKKKCKNPHCKEETIEVSLDDVDEYTLHYILPPIKDTIKSDSDQKIIHIFGGDYNSNYGENNIPKYKIIQELMNVVAKDVPDIHIGPLVTSNGRKMSKSNSKNRQLFKDIDDKKRYDTVKQIIETLITTDRKTIEFKETT